MPHGAIENRSGTETRFLKIPYPRACLHTPFFKKAGHVHSYLKRTGGESECQAVK